MSDIPAPAPAASRRATIYDVARRAGVSHATVTRMLRGFEGIRPETRERVQKALEELDYRPNLTARSLITGRSHRVGAVMHEIDQVGPSRIVQGAAAAARRTGYVLDIVTVDTSDPGAIDESLALMTQNDLAGVIVLASTDEMNRAYQQAQFRVPVELSFDEENAEGLDSPMDLAVDGLVAHLASLGHRRIFHISGPRTWAAARNREGYFRAAAARHRITWAGAIEGDWSSASGHAAVQHLPDGVTAIAAANDQMALGALRGLEERGIRVPDDVSVTGVDDIPEAAFLRPPLSTIRLDFLAQGEGVFMRLLRRIDPEAVRQSQPPTASFVARSSTGATPVVR